MVRFFAKNDIIAIIALFFYTALIKLYVLFYPVYYTAAPVDSYLGHVLSYALDAMSKLKDIKKPIEKELDKFEGIFKDSMKSTVPLLDRITYYIVRRKGKQVRPMFVFLCARIFGPIQENTFTAASLIELLHTASLVHDDVIDDSHQRRGAFSINALWKNKIAVLVGDYLLSKGLLLAVETEQFETLKIVSTAVKQLSEGELLQFEKTRKLDITEDIYFDIILSLIHI